MNGLVVQLVHIENCTLLARKNAPSPGEKGKKKKALDLQGLSWVGGRNRTRTCDPIDVNDVLWAGGRVVKLLPSGVHMSQTS